MDPVVFVEILDERLGKVKERVRLDRFPATIGRGYDNQVIVDDRFMSPRHVAIEVDEQGRLVARDLQSDNGLYVHEPWRRVDAVMIVGEAVLRIGHTFVRLRTPELAVAPTAVERLGPGSVSAVLRSRWAVAFLLLTVVGWNLVRGYLESFVQVKAEQLFLLAIPSLLIVLVWAGLWALAERVFSHRTSFVTHGSLACLALLALYGVNLLNGYYAFAFSADVSATLMQYAAWTVLAALLLYGHLRVIAVLPPNRLAGIACSIAGIAMVLGILTSAALDEELHGHDQLQFASDLKPLTFKMVRSRSTEDFVTRATKLKDRIDKLAQED